MSQRLKPRQTELQHARAIGAAIIAFATCCGPVNSAFAQAIIPTAEDFSAEAQAIQESVEQQPRQEYRPHGIRFGQLFSSDEYPYADKSPAGKGIEKLRPGEDPKRSFTSFRDGGLDSFLLRPKFEVDVEFDDNIFRTQDDEDSDRIYVFRPELKIASDWLNHGLELEMGAEFGKNEEFSDEDYSDYFITIAPLIDVDENTVLELFLGYTLSHVARGSTDDALEGPEPAVDGNIDASITWQYKSDKYSTRLLYEGTWTDAEDNGPIERDFLDLQRHAYLFRQGYEFTTGTTVWVQPRYELFDYRQSFDDNGLVRDNEGWTLLGGLTIDRSAVSFLEVGVGVSGHDFEQSGQDEFFGFAYEGRLLWNITSLMTLDFTFGRTPRVAQSTDSPIAIEDGFVLSLAWDPLENLILKGVVSFSHSDFETLPGQEREEDLSGFLFEVRYLMNENIYFEGRYEFSHKNSTEDGSDFDSNSFRLRAGVEL